MADPTDLDVKQIDLTYGPEIRLSRSTGAGRPEPGDDAAVRHLWKTAALTVEFARGSFHLDNLTAADLRKLAGFFESYARRIERGDHDARDAPPENPLSTGSIGNF